MERRGRSRGLSGLRSGESRKVTDLLVEAALAVYPSLDIRPYTPKDLKEARPTNFLGHIVSTGRVVYKGGVIVEPMVRPETKR